MGNPIMKDAVKDIPNGTKGVCLKEARIRLAFIT
jgi:hypothetical protein